MKSEISIGPTLAEIVKKYPRRNEMLQQVIQPSLKVDEKFTTYSVATDSGKVFNRLLVSQTKREIVLKTADKKIIRFLADDIDEVVKSKKSLMPERLLSDLSAQEAADLLAYIRSIKK